MKINNLNFKSFSPIMVPTNIGNNYNKCLPVLNQLFRRIEWYIATFCIELTLKRFMLHLKNHTNNR